MDIKITKKDVVWGYLARFFQIGSGLLILPVILNRLQTEEIAIWYIFLSVTALVNLLDFGFQNSILRNTSYIFSGANELLKEGITDNTSSQINYSLLVTFISSVKILYRRISILAFFLLGTLGSLHIYNISAGKLETSSTLTAWGIYIISPAINLYYYYYTPLLLGRGFIKESNKSLVLSKFAYIFFAIVSVSLGYGLVAIAISNLVGALVNRTLSKKYFYNDKLKEKLSKKSIGCTKSIFKKLWFNSKKAGVISLAYFLMRHATLLLCSSLLSLDETARYGLTIQLVDVLTSVALMPMTILLPKLNMLSLKKKPQSIEAYLGLILISSLLVVFLGNIILIFLGDSILLLLKSRTNLLGFHPLMIIFVYTILGVNYSIFCHVISIHNVIPYTTASIFSGIGIVILSVILEMTFSFGVLSFIYSTFLVQLFYNNWKWPLYFMKTNNTTYPKILKSGTKLILTKLGAAQND